jgi:hypothetical protein
MLQRIQVWIHCCLWELQNSQASVTIHKKKEINIRFNIKALYRKDKQS